MAGVSTGRNEARLVKIAARLEDAGSIAKRPRLDDINRTRSSHLPTIEHGSKSTAQVLPQAKAEQWARTLYDGAVDRKDAVGFAAVFADDAWMRFGNNDPVVGKQNIEAAIAGFFTMIAALDHDTTGIFSHGDALILEAKVTYTRHDGRKVTIPAVTIMRLVAGKEGPLVKRCQMYVDLAPLFA